ncbi:MAG TPA: DNA polymerase IV [Nitrososphaera sp.]|nr:DNA polymerase IV [Nitrososphaera sp.]
MTRYFIGCSGWRYGSWVPGFYPATLGPREYLSYYSRIFDLAAVGVQAVQAHALRRWAGETPDNFRFLVRVSTQATDCGLLGEFLEGLAAMKEKILAVVVRMSAPNLLKDREWLDKILAACADSSYSAAVEFDHASWLQDMTYNILRRRGAAAAWSDRHPDPVVTSDFVCLHLAGGNDRAWIEKVKEQAEQERLKFAAITVDNPDRVNRVLKLLGLPERKYASHLPAPSILQKEAWADRVVMCVDLNAFYPSCEELREPALAGRPHAVIMTDQRDRITKGVVSSCSYEARKFGVRSAMPLARALALCPDLVLRPVDIQYYQQASEKIMGVLGQFADVLEQASIDEAFLDCSRSAAADPHGHAARIKATIREQCGLRVSIGVAPCKSVAKMASDFQKPDGLTVVHPQQMAGFLGPLEVGRISGIGPKTRQALKNIGVETIGQLAACDVQKLTERFGRNGLWMWKVATGSEDEAVQPREDHVSLSTEHTLDEFTKDRDRILVYLCELVDEIYDRLVRRGYMFRTVGVKLVRSDFTIETRETSFPDLQARRESISSVIEQLLGRFSFDDPAPAIRKVGLRVTNLVSAHEEESQIKMQKTILDYMSMPDMLPSDI